MTSKIEAASEADLVKWNSAAMQRLERIWDEVIARADARTEGRGVTELHHATARAEMIRAKLTILHREMDCFAADYGDVPIARSGER